ncbi:MAG: IrrE N-terminal-like domain [Hyphomicrobiales bacterium]|jgi:transcriptional regulator with XRE-family HTH domain|nr:IrrE N-terminal-like domain [Hyphomicrobiales bacterium]
MTGLTDFGIVCRRHRTLGDLVMADQAKALGYTSSYISQIERGEREIPEDYSLRVAEWLQLNEAETNELLEAASASRKSVKFFPADAERAKVADQFARELNSLPPEKLSLLKQIFETEHTKKHSAQEVESLATVLRAIFDLGDRVRFDALRIIENWLWQADSRFSLQIAGPSDLLGKVKAYTEADSANSPRILVSEQTYAFAAERLPDAQYTLIHEFAHFLFHRKRRQTRGRFSKYKNIEAHADYFARTFILPAGMVRKFDDPNQLARICGVPLWLAKKRMGELGLWPKFDPDVAKKFQELSAELGANASKQSCHQVISGRIEPLPHLTERASDWFEEFGWHE